MATDQDESRVRDWLRRHGGLRLMILVIGLAVLAGLVAVRDPDPWDNAVGQTASLRPTRELILGYLDGKAVIPTEVAGTAAPFTLAREKIEALKIRYDDNCFTSVKFVARVDGGTYAVEAVIDLQPTDGSYVFTGLRVSSAVRR